MAQEEKDRLKREIDLLGKVLGTLLSRLLSMKNASAAEALQVSNAALEIEVEYTLDDLLVLDDTRLIDDLLRKGFKYESLGQIADIFYKLAEDAEDGTLDHTMRAKLYKKAGTIYTYLNEGSPTYSLDRHFKIARIKGLEL